MREDVTGRDDYIEAQALYLACRMQEELKRVGSTEYEWSNHQDMKAILNYRHPVLVGVFQMEDESRGARPLDMTDEKEREPAA